MLTAHKARVLAGPTVSDILESVYQKIETAAKSKKFEIKLRDEVFARGGYSADSEYRDLYDGCVAELESKGYNVKYFFVTSQFVDAGITVSWENAK